MTHASLFSRRVFGARVLRHGTKQRPPTYKRGGAPEGACKWPAPHSQMLPPERASGADARHGQCPCGHRPVAGALAFRRSAAALVAGRTMHDSVQAALHAIKMRRSCLRALASRLSQAPGSPVVMPAGSMPGPPGSGLRGRPREPHSLHLQDRIRKAPFAKRAAALLLGARRDFKKFRRPEASR